MQLKIFLIHTGFFIAFSYLNIIIHETGHAVFARMVHIPVRYIYIGSGNNRVCLTIFGIDVIFTDSLKGGFTIPGTIAARFFKVKFFLFVSGGILLQFIIFFLFTALFNVHLMSFFFADTITIGSCFTFATLTSILFNTIPMFLTRHGIKTYNDGLYLIMIPLLSKDAIIKLSAMSATNNGTYLMEHKNYEAAIVQFQQTLELYPQAIQAQINLSASLIKLQRIDQAIFLLETMTKSPCSKAHTAMIYNNLAWACLLKFERHSLQRAEAVSEIVCRYYPDNLLYKQNRGIILIANSNNETGLEILKNAIDQSSGSFSYSKPSAIVLLFAAYACWQCADLFHAHCYLQHIERCYDNKDAEYIHLRDILFEITSNFSDFQKNT